MTPEDSPDKAARQSRVGWWAAWLLVLGLASALPYLHWSYDVAAIIEPLRHPWGLLPAHWLFFRWTGEIALYALVLVGLCGVWAWFQPKHRRAIIVLAAMVALVSNVAGAMFASRLMIAFIHEEAQRTTEERLRQNVGAGAASKDSIPEEKK
jgi:hypothetical protein